MLSTHKGTTKDSRGCEFEYYCYTRKDRAMKSDNGRIYFEDDIDRDYVVYGNEAKGHGRNNIMAEAKTLKELKAKMGAL